MKGVVLSIVLLLAGIAAFGQKEDRRFAVATSLGSGIALNRPAKTPFTWQVKGYYGVTSRLFAGIGTGISVYEKTLLPVFAEAKYVLGRSREFTPYMACEAGYAFAFDRKEANGGLYLVPAIGVHYRVARGVRLTFAVGYELQKFDRVKSHRDDHFLTEFKERLSHQSVAFRLGVIF